MHHHTRPSFLLSLAMSSTLSVCAFAAPTGASFTVSTGSPNTTAQSLGAGNSGTVESNGLLSVSGGSIAITINGTSTITNNGTIEQIGTKNGIFNDTANAILTLNNNGIITSVGDDTVKVEKATAGIILNNQGTIWHKGTTAGIGQALDFEKITSAGSSIVNGSISNTAALIQADGDDALRPGSNMSILNYGTIISKGTVNTKMTGTLVSGTEAKAQDGIDVQGSTGVTIDNYGLVSGPRHGITADVSVAVTNRAGGVIIGNNGSGVGTDGTGTVVNYGTITGAYAGAGKAYEHSATNGGTSTANNGDGDGVDIDGIGTITNYGLIQALGAGGVDSDGNPNGADGIAAGGGTIINHAGATIYGQSKGILIDDGANGTTSFVRGTGGVAIGGVATITNSGTITGDKKTAIGLVGDYADTITNNSSGVITGGKDSVLVDALASTTAAAAIQMGGGADTLTNHGKIEGKNGIAIDMGDGDDALALMDGSVIGTITGGSGVNSLTLGGTQRYSKNVINNFQNLTTQNSAVIEAEIKESTSALPFTGTVVLADGTSIQPIIKGKVANGSSHTIISATSLTANASQLEIIDTSALLDYTLAQSGNDLNLIVSAKEIKNIANGQFAGLSNALQNLGNNEALLEKIASLGSEGEIREAIKQLSPDAVGAALQAAIGAQGTVFASLSGRMGGSRGGSMASAQSGLNAGDDTTTRGWVELLGSTAKQDARKGNDGYKIDAAGIAVGYEKEVSANGIAGVTAGYTGAKSYGYDGASGDTTDIDSFHAGIYYGRTTSTYTLDTALVASVNSYNGSRNVSAFSETEKSSYDGYALGALAEVGIPFSMGNSWAIKPVLGAQYSYNTIGAYDESGGIAALHIDETDSSSFRSVVGTEFSHVLNSQSGYTLGVRYLHEFASAPSTTAGFIGSGATFSVDGSTPPRDALQLGFDYHILTAENKTLSAGYDAEIKDQYLSHQFRLKMVF